MASGVNSMSDGNSSGPGSFAAGRTKCAQDTSPMTTAIPKAVLKGKFTMDQTSSRQRAPSLSRRGIRLLSRLMPALRHAPAPGAR